MAGGSGGAGGTVAGTTGKAGSSMGGTGVVPSAGSGGAAAGQGGAGGAAGGGTGGAAGAAGMAGSAGAAGSAGSGGSGGGAPVCTVPPTGGEDFKALLAGPKAIEGEVAELGGAAAEATEGSGWTGTGFADMKASEGSMTWLIDAPAAGKYTLDWIYTQNDGRDMRLTVNCAQVAASVPFTNTGSWNTMWATGGTQVVTLKKGTNQVLLETNGGSGPNFDAMLVSPPICELGAGAATCEAERALMSGATGLAAQGSGWLGEGFADMFGGEGAVNWVLNAPEAGIYTLTFRYTQQDTRDMSLTVNGVVAAASLGFNNTNSWNAAWAADVSQDVTLTAGLNSVQLATNGASGPNFDSVSVSSLGTGGADGAGGAP